MVDEQAAFATLVARIAERDAVDVPTEAVGPLAKYCALLRHHGSRTNLVGTLEPERIVAELVLDSLRLLPLLGAESGRVVDIGSGGGIPIVPLLIALPEWRGVAVEPRARRAAFLATVRRALLPERLTVVRGRLVDGVIDGEHAETPFDLAVSRAVFAPQEWVRLAEPLVCSGGEIGAWCTGPRSAIEPWIEARAARAVQYAGPSGTMRTVLCLPVP